LEDLVGDDELDRIGDAEREAYQAIAEFRRIDLERNCPPCDEDERVRAAIVEVRRGMLSLERGFAALLKAINIEDLT